MRIHRSVALVAAGFVLLAAGCSGGGSSRSTPPAPALSNPAVTSVTPIDGDVAGGLAITITGSGFVTGAAVNVGGNAATGVTVVSGTSITATTPSGSAGPANIVVINPDTQSATLTNGFTYTSSGGNQAPTFSAVSPTSGPTAGGTVVTVTGSGFYSGVTVTVGGTLATGVALVSGSTLTCTTPSGSAGAANVVVTNADAQSATGTGAFTYVAPPNITSITPGNGPQPGGITVTLGGTDFVTGATVTFGANAATITLLTATSIEVTLPASASSGAVTVTVTNPDTQNDTTSFTYDPPPTVSGVNPSSGPQAGGTTVTVGGTGFVNGATITFGGVSATNLTFLSATQYQCDTPAGTGTVTVTLTNPDGQSGSATSAYAYNPPPSISSISPNTGPAAGGTTVTVTGSNFVTGATLTFGGVSATNVTVFSTYITGDTPAGTGAVTVTVTNPDTQSASQSNGFTYTSSLTVTNVQPASGTTNGGTPLTITGTGFALGAGVTIGSASCGNIMVLSSTTILCTSPAGTGTGLTVTVTVSATQANWSNTWSYVTSATAPSISTVSPITGPAAGGTTVTVTGSNFGSAPAVTIDGVSATVTGSSATAVTITSPAALHCVAGGALPIRVIETASGEPSNAFSGFTYTPNQTEGLAVDLGLPDVVIDGAGTIHVVFQNNPSGGNNDIQYRRSSDGGKTWNTGGISSGRVTQTAVNSTNARVAARGNTVFIVWQEAGTNTSCDYVYSTDNGANWTNIASLPANSTSAVTGLPDVALDGNGRVYAVWLETGNTGAWGTDIDVWTVSGTPSGIGSATPVQLSPGGDFCTGPAIDADGNGNAIAAWTATVNGPVVTINNTVDWSRTTNSGSNWSTAASLHTASAARSSVGVALRGNGAVIAFVQTAFGVSTTYAVESYYSTNTGQSWAGSVNVRTGSTTVISSSAIAVDAGSFFGVTWSEVGASQTDVFCSRSSNVGVSWSTPVAFAPSGSASTQPRVAAGGAGTWAHVWAENNSGTNDIVHW